MKCYLCGSTTFTKQMGWTRDNPHIYPTECVRCGLVTLSEQPKIDYQNNRIYLAEPTKDDDRRGSFFYNLVKDKSVLDFGCGGAQYLKQYAKHQAKDCAGVEPCLSAESPDGIPIYHSLDEVKGKYDVVTMFQVVEHLYDPKEILNKIKEKLNTGGLLVIETPNNQNALLSLYRCKAFSEFTHWTCHPYLYGEKSLNMLAEQCGYKKYQFYYIQRYPLSGHLYWLAEGKPEGQDKWQHLDCQEYDDKMAEHKISDTIIGIWRK